MHLSTIVLLSLVIAVAASDRFSSRGNQPGLRKRCKKAAQHVLNAASAQNPSSSSNTTSSIKAASNGDRNWLKRNCVTWGWIGDDGNKPHGSTGVLEIPSMLDETVGRPAKYFGAYAHLQGDQYKQSDSSTWFDGHEILPFVDYLKGTGSIAVLSVMPVYGFGGMSTSDNTQALQLAKVIKKFDDAGIEVYLRWGHEVNWYFSPNSDDAGSGQAYYQGSASQYIEAWKVVTAAARSAVPSVKMFWSPNIGSAADYAKYWPGKDYVDIVGVDYYPNGNYADLASHVQNIHDTYAQANNIPFHIGETGSTADVDTKLDWVDVVTSDATCAALPKLEAVHWFNYAKRGDFRLTGDATTTSDFVHAMSS